MTTERNEKSSEVERLSHQLDDLDYNISGMSLELKSLENKAILYEQSTKKLRSEVEHWKAEHKKAMEIISRLCQVA